MSRRDIANLAFKIAGLYCFIQAAQYISFVPAIFQGSVSDLPPIFAAIAAIASPALLVAGGAFLFLKSHSLAEKTFPDAQPQSPPERILGVHALAFSIVAVFLLADALPSLIASLCTLPPLWGKATPGLRELLRVLAQPALKTVLGVGLFLGSHGLVRLWAKLRYSGLHTKLGICTSCGYDLTGNTSGVCPECGAAIRHQQTPEAVDSATSVNDR